MSKLTTNPVLSVVSTFAGSKLDSPKWLAVLLCFLFAPNLSPRGMMLIIIAAQVPDLAPLVLGHSYSRQLPARLRRVLRDWLGSLVFWHINAKIVMWVLHGTFHPKIQLSPLQSAVYCVWGACSLIGVYETGKVWRWYLASRGDTASDSQVVSSAQDILDAAGNRTARGHTIVPGQPNSSAGLNVCAHGQTIHSSGGSAAAQLLAHRLPCMDHHCAERQATLVKLVREALEIAQQSTACYDENVKFSEEILRLRTQMLQQTREHREDMTQLRATCQTVMQGTKRLAYELSQENTALRDLLDLYKMKIAEWQAATGSDRASAAAGGGNGV